MATLLAFFSEDFSRFDVKALRGLAQELASAGPWSRGSPEFVDDVDDSSCTQPGDEPIRTVGLVLTIGDRDREPQTPVAELERFVAALAAFSAKRGVDFELELDQDAIGSIFNGIVEPFVRMRLFDS